MWGLGPGFAGLHMKNCPCLMQKDYHNVGTPIWSRWAVCTLPRPKETLEKTFTQPITPSNGDDPRVSVDTTGAKGKSLIASTQVTATGKPLSLPTGLGTTLPTAESCGYPAGIPGGVHLPRRSALTLTPSLWPLPWLSLRGGLFGYCWGLEHPARRGCVREVPHFGETWLQYQRRR